MTLTRLTAAAWAGTITATVACLLYVKYAPIQGSRTAGTLLTVGVASMGAIAGAVMEMRLENRIRSRQPRAEIIKLPTERDSAERLTVRAVRGA